MITGLPGVTGSRVMTGGSCRCLRGRQEPDTTEPTWTDQPRTWMHTGSWYTLGHGSLLFCKCKDRQLHCALVASSWIHHKASVACSRVIPFCSIGITRYMNMGIPSCRRSQQSRHCTCSAVVGSYSFHSVSRFRLAHRVPANSGDTVIQNQRFLLYAS